MYLPFPDQVDVSDTVTVTLEPSALKCSPVLTNTGTAIFTHPKSTEWLEQRPNEVHSNVIRPTKDKWSEVKKSGRIKMTEMSVVNELHSHFVGLVQHPYFAYERVGRSTNIGLVKGKCKDCVVHETVQKLAKVKGRYVEQGDLDYWKAKYPDAPHYSGLPVLDSSRVERAKSKAYSDLFQAYNLGEELVELRETFFGVSKLILEGLSLIKSAKKTFDLVKHAKPKDYKKELSNRWMEFRYGIMPIIYSIQDLTALSQEVGKYRTVRSTVWPENRELAEDVLSDDSLLDDVCFYDRGAYDVRCSITAKARWATQELKMLDLVNVNPITTALEVYPWAMVVRWFINVSEYFSSRIKSLTSLSLESCACVATKVTAEYGTYLFLRDGYDITVSWDGNSDCGSGWYGYHEWGPFVDKVDNRILLTWHSINNYDRYLYSPQDVELVWSPYFDWRRAIDSMILGERALSKALRSFKRWL